MTIYPSVRNSKCMILLTRLLFLDLRNGPISLGIDDEDMEKKNPSIQLGNLPIIFRHFLARIENSFFTPFPSDKEGWRD